MNDWRNPKKNLEEELQSGYHTTLELVGMPIFIFGTQHRL
jgi:hypothetical protein